MCPTSLRSLKQMTRHTIISLSQAPFSHSPGHSSFRGHHRPKNSYTLSIFLSITQLFLRSLLPLRARHLQQPTSLIFTFNSASMTPLIHRVTYAIRSSHVLNFATALAPAEITHNIQERNSSSYEEIAMCKSCSYGDS